MKKKQINSENKRMYTIFGVLALIIILIIIGVISKNVKSTNIAKKVESLLNSSEAKAIYIMRDGCTYCELNESNMNSIVKEYNFEYYNIDTNDLSEKDLNKIISTLKIDETNFGTPYLVAVKDGEVIGSLNGMKSYKVLFDFLKENELIDKDSKLYLNYPTLSEYKKLIKSGEKEVFILATSTCKFCLAEHPVLIDIAKETGAKINYLYLDYMFNSQEEYDEFMSSLKWFEDNTDWGTPTTLIVKNKEVRNYLSGYREKDEVISYYKENGIIK
nr:hypothetical protein [Bacilli bacterium]